MRATVDWPCPSALLLAATDTTSASIVRAVHLLSQHPSVQEKLRREVLEATIAAGRGVSDLDYDALANLRYLDAVVRETLRLCARLLFSDSCG